jgi:hypothetical protein
MNHSADFKSFYKTNLLPDLVILDKERKNVDRKVLAIGVLAIISVVILGRLIENASIFFQSLAVILAFILISIVSKNYRKNFKAKIIQKITGFVDENLVYSPEGYVSKEEFNKSLIFQKESNNYKGEDHFKGNVGTTGIEFSEVVARQTTSTGTGSNRKESHSVIFKGIFFVADFSKHFQGHTVILPDTAEKIMGKIGQSLQSLSSRGELIKLENPEFEKEFCVYGDDQVEARYILSPSLMQRILEYKRKWNTKVYLSFLESKVYIAIEQKKNLFETRLFKSIADYKFIEENVRFLILMAGVVEDLNLNTRIWTKE